MEGTPLLEAYEWLLENPSKSIDAASRIFKIHRLTIRLRINQLACPKKPRGGKNKVLSTA